MTLKRKIYRIARSILFSAILFVVAVYLMLYILLSVPAVQTRIKEVAERELTTFLGGKVGIDRIIIYPFNELVAQGLTVSDPQGEVCLKVDKLGAGISLWKFIKDREIDLTYAEIIGLKGNIRQPEKDSPLNIAFLIDAFKPKDKNKPPTQFDLKIRSVVLRRCEITYDKEWMGSVSDARHTDFNHLRIYDLKADLYLPRIKNDDFLIDLRRLSFKVSGGMDVEKLALQTHITNHSISVNNLMLELPGTQLRPSDFSLNFTDFRHIGDAFKDGIHRIVLIDNKVTPADFAPLWTPLENLYNPLTLSVEVEGNTQNVSLNRLALTERDIIDLDVEGSLNFGKTVKDSEFVVRNLSLNLSEEGEKRWSRLLPETAGKVKEIMAVAAPLALNAQGKGNMKKGNYEGEVKLISSCGNITAEGEMAGLTKDGGRLKIEASTEDLNLGKLIQNKDLGIVTADVRFDGVARKKDITGSLNTEVATLIYKGKDLGGISLELTKGGKEIEGNLLMDNAIANVDLSAAVLLNGTESEWNVGGRVGRFSPSTLGLKGRYSDYSISGEINAELTGNNPDNIYGTLYLKDFDFGSPGKESLHLNTLKLTSATDGDDKTMKLDCDWLSMELNGRYKLKDIPAEGRNIAAAVLPSLITSAGGAHAFDLRADFSLLIHPDNTLTEFFNLPVRLLVPIVAGGSIDGGNAMLKAAIDIPYLQQGKNKLLRNNRLMLEANGETGSFSVDVASTVPAKKSDVNLGLRLWGQRDNVEADVDWKAAGSTDFKGRLSLDALLSKNEFSNRPEINVAIKPSIFEAGTARWNIGESGISYKGDVIDVDHLRIWHDSQFVEINGRASSSPLDSVTVNLAAIDLNYIFDTLNINYVSFGGIATGGVTGRGVLGKTPVLSTDNLYVENLAYNGGVLGDGLIRSQWVNEEKKVEILADITKDGERKASVDGGIWVTRDSLSFDIGANRVAVDFLGPFMAAFTSDVKGYASGNAKLFGSFSDIDLTGSIYADSLMMKLDYTNTYYHGSDSVYLRPGKIEIPSFKLYDNDGNSGVFSGELRHRYFHDPEFTFRLKEANHLLCYDTNAKLNPDWYGKIYGNGGVVITGRPGVVIVSVDMAVVGNSSFTFVLNETEAARDYNFLTFSDRRKEAAEKEVARNDSVEDMLSMFRQKVQKKDDQPSNFILDLRATVTPTALLTLVMDPRAGDKITARGGGALRMNYETDTDELQMFGKYTLDEGNYNFSLQDLILKDFIIKHGSSISFNGDPMNAMLDITAAYRVNTNLSDLDKSFATDKELNRTNVPVDAMLMVKGEMQQPDITFDIVLPTLTQDVERKVKSIISTDDMMSRQIIYLLALNRFYTPEYMGSSSNGGELAAVASSTLSSQLTNMIGQLTDKFSVAPSIRSDKGDFSDVEVDVALSSRLLNNRLLINGNFGYRDRSTSTTTFVGDFDIEYLLTGNGNLRLKAYNHFNDQNYYLREALTTQGLGIVFRKDFDDAFKWLRRNKKEMEKTDSVAAEREEIEGEISK